MDRTSIPSKTSARRALRAARPFAEALESRALLSINGYSDYRYNYNNQSGWAAQAVYDFHKYAGELRLVENRSHATPAEFQALRDDARAIGAAASANAAASGLSTQTLTDRASAVTTVLDAAPLDGWLSTAQWSNVETRLQRPLNGLNVPQALINQTFADLQTLAHSANVDRAEFHYLANVHDHINIDRYYLYVNNQTPRYGYNYPLIPDPSLYYSQHLRGFSRGGIPLARSTQAALARDLGRIEAGTPAAERQVIARDASSLQAIGAAVSSDAEQSFAAAYTTLFAQGSPTSTQLAALKTNLPSLLGTTATTRILARADSLVDDAPEFFKAVGLSVANIDTIVADTQNLADAGGGTLLNPFRVHIVAY